MSNELSDIEKTLEMRLEGFTATLENLDELLNSR